MFFSFNVGPVHFISVSTEYLYDPINNPDWAELMGQGAEIQHRWLVKDLEEANAPETRRQNSILLQKLLYFDYHKIYV